jgi:SAM-dependent methyltransferase
MPLSSDHKVPVDDLELIEWLKDGSRYTPTLPDVASWLFTWVDGPILDVGCGSGELLRLLRLRGLGAQRLYGQDLRPGHVELAKRRTGLDNVAVGSLAERVGFRGVQFAAICTINWLQGMEEIDELDAIAENVASALRPDGVWVWDCHTADDGRAMADTLLQGGWREKMRLEFEATAYPEAYTVYVYHR